MNQLAQLVFVESERVRRVEPSDAPPAQRAAALIVQWEAAQKRGAALDAKVFRRQRLRFGQASAAHRDARKLRERLIADSALVGEQEGKKDSGDRSEASRRSASSRVGTSCEPTTAEDAPPETTSLHDVVAALPTDSRSARCIPSTVVQWNRKPRMQTFYIETFGCQMNAHDSEKVIGTLLSQGYQQVAKPDQADLVLYNTCSIRDKAEQKVFHRLDEFKRDGKGKVFGVLGCVAQQEGEQIFERAPHVSLVAGSASYAKLPEMLVQLEAGNRRVTGLSLGQRSGFRHAVHQAR